MYPISLLKKPLLPLVAAVGFILLGCQEASSQEKMVTVYPEAYPGALRNPLKGFRPNYWGKLEDNRFMTLARVYVKWNELDTGEADDLVANIKAYSKKKWARFNGTGVKVIPRVYLDWNKESGNEYWPGDLETGDYSSPEFKKRLTRLIEAMGECWDNDPRVAWIQMGMIGYWGEHHNPHPDDAMQTLLGTAFEKAFKNKHVLVRHPGEFTDYEFGIYWDSWAHERQTGQLMHGAGIEQLNDETARWKTRPIEGEVAYDWGTFRIQPGDDPNDTLSDPVHREFLIDTIRNLHATALGWISDYDQSLPQVVAGADEVQRAFGYRFEMERFRFTPSVTESGEFRFDFDIRNTGSAPFYQDWPVLLNLLDPETRQVVWSREMEDVDLRTWLPGEDWDEAANVYGMPAETHTVQGAFFLPPLAELPAGEYIIALSIPDPVLNELGLRLAIKNYMKGDLHPLGRLFYGVEVSGDATIDSQMFSDPMGDR